MGVAGLTVLCVCAVVCCAGATAAEALPEGFAVLSPSNFSVGL